ncbi:efflux RND transporter permease subunit [Serratia marcescens]|uniref:efflux RND transporter permease subunit n=1 Tax=Serratia marcescens TaxID=615 RepID=UPI000C9A7D8D|nr:efflux RND transporter permease subunit [Serratia marcescens]
MNASEREKFNLSAWALANQQLVAFFMLVLTIAGVMSYYNLPRNEDPAFTIKTAVVSASWPGASVEDTVNFVTDPLEKKLQEVPYLDYLESYSRPGESVIFIYLRDNTPPEKVKELWYTVRKKIKDVSPQLPAGVSSPAVNDEFDDTYGTIYGFTREGFSERELRDLVDKVRTDVLTLPDVGKVNLLGVKEEQVILSFSPQKIAGMGLTLDQIKNAISAQNAVTPAGEIRTDKDKVMLRVSGAFASEESLKQLTLHIQDKFVPLTDIATISREAVDPPTPAFRVNGESAIGLAISMAPTGNMLDFGKALNEKMDDISSRLPAGINVLKVADQSTVVHDAVGSFMKVLLEAVVIVLAVSFLSLGTRAGLVVAASIPLVLAMTFIGMEIAGIGIQRISLGALIIALGLLVDDAMITVEIMMSRLEKGDPVKKAATKAWTTTAFPMLTGTLVMIAGFIPVGFATSSAGEYCYSLFMVVLISLINSWIVAVLFSPLIGVWLLPKVMKEHAHGKGKVMQKYESALRYILKRRGMTCIVAVLLLAISFIGSSHMEEEFFPASDRPELLVSLTLPRNAVLEDTAREAIRLEEILKKDPDIDHFTTYVGSGAVRFYLPMDLLLDNENIAQLVVVTKGLEERDAVKSRLEKILQKDFDHLVTRASPLELGPPVGWPLKYRVSGPDLTKIREISMELAAKFGDNPQTREVNLTAGEPQRELYITLNQTEARALGLSSQDVASALAEMYSGSAVTTIRDRNRQVNVVLRASENTRRDIETVADLQLTTADGRVVPLKQIATIGYTLAEPIQWRRQREPFITVQMDIAPGLNASGVSKSLAPVVDELRKNLPPGYHITEGGSVIEAMKGNRSVFAVLPVTLLVMLILLMVQLRSFSRMMLALLIAPFGLIGVVAAMLPTGTPMGFVALLGVIALAGMIIRNAVILIEEVEINRAQGADNTEAIVEASLHRSRPILLTACAAILGMIPIAHQVFWGPMAYAIIGGLFVATLFTLTVLPAAISAVLQWEKSR